MSFLGALTGSDAKDYANKAATANSAQLSAGYNANQGYENTGYQSALGRYSPYAQQGQNAWTQYGNMLGMNGQQAQQSAYSAYQQSNPMWNANLPMLMQTQDRRAAATGQFGSGLNALARGRIANEQANSNYTDYMNRLQGMGQQGLGIAQAQAGLDTQHAGNMTNIENAYRSGNIQNTTNQYNALSAANQAGFQNMLGLGSTLFGAAIGGANSYANLAKAGAVGGGGSNSYGNGGWSTMVSPSSGASYLL